MASVSKDDREGVAAVARSHASFETARGAGLLRMRLERLGFSVPRPCAILPPMNAPLKTLTVEAYIDWALQQPRGRFELLRGEIVPINAERTGHARIKHRIAVALEQTIAAAGIECHMLPDGATMRIDDHTAFEPDALVYRGDLLPDDTIIIPEPVIVVEVLSPSTASIDASTKFAGYFKVPSIAHYLIFDGPARTAVHHRREADGTIRSAVIAEGNLTLDPPGLTVPLAAIFAAR